MDIQRCFEILEIEPGTSLQDIKRIYRDLVYVWHPDRFAHNTRLKKRAEEKVKQFNRAYRLIVDAGKHGRRVVDKKTVYLEEKRRFSRSSCDLSVEYETPDRSFRAFFDPICNISASGVFIKTQRKLPVDQSVFLSFNLPRFGKLMNIAGKVTRTCDEGIAVEFDISPKFQKLIASFV